MKRMNEDAEHILLTQFYTYGFFSSSFGFYLVGRIAHKTKLFKEENYVKNLFYERKNELE